MDILFATSNQGKINETRNHANKFNINIISISDLKVEIPVPAEDRQTYQGNAELKAKYYFEQTKLPCLADDSGLEILSLNNEPGVDTAIYGGEHLSYNERMQLVINKLKEFKDRSARYVCHLSYYDGSSFKNANGYLNGKISETLNGEGGFGYDPIFIPENHDYTSAQLKKDGVQFETHRTKALSSFFKLWSQELNK